MKQKRLLSILMLLLLGILSAPAGAQGEIGPEAVWRPTGDQQDELWDCRQTPGCSIAELLAAQGAPPAAVAFALSRDPFEFLAEFEEHGRVDLGLIFLPMSNYIFRYDMVNGNPPVVSSDSIGFVDMSAIPEYASLYAQYPDLTLWPVATAARGEAVGSGQRFIFEYPLVDGCHACENLGKGQVAFNFDAAGDYVGITHLGPVTDEAPPPAPLTDHPNYQIAYVILSDSGPYGGNIWLGSEAGSDRQQITNSNTDCCLAWSPDGRLLYFVRNAKTKDHPPTAPSGDLMVYDFRTGEEREIEVPADVHVSNALAVSPDGRFLAFASSGQGDGGFPFGLSHQGCLNVMELETGVNKVVDCETPGAIYDITYSPSDGTLAADVGYYEGSRIAFYSSLDSPRRHDDNICCYDLEFTADGAGFYAIGGGYGDSDIRFYPQPSSGPSILLRSTTGLDYFGNPDLSPDGNQLLYTRNNEITIMDLATGATTLWDFGHAPVWRPAQDPAPDIGLLLDRLEAAIGQLESTTYETSGGVIYPEPIPAFDQTAAHRLLGDLRAADPMTITPEQAEALERLVLQEEALVILLDDYTILTNDLADVKADLAGMVVGVVLLKEQVRRDLAKAILELALKAIQDFIKLWLFAIEDEELRESARNVIEDLPLLIAAATQDVDAGLEEFVDRAIGDGVRAVAASMFISDLADAVQPAVDQGVRTVQSGDEPVWPVESNSEVASIQLDGLTTQSGIMRELAHDVYVNSLMRGRDVNALLTDIADIFTLGLRARIAAIYSIQTRIHQILIDTAANSVLSGAMTCTRDAAVDSGEYAFQPDRPGYGCEVPVPLDLRDFFDRLLGEGPRRSYAGRLAPPAQSSAPEFDAALLAYGAAVEGLRAAVAAGDAAAVRARADELLPAAQTLDSAAVPLVARLTAETGISEGEMALGVALTLVRLDAFFALLAAEAYLADPAVADTETFNDVLGKAEENTVLLERVRAQVPLPLTPAAALPMIDAPATWDAVVGQPLDIPVTVANLGGAPFAAARLIVAVDGQMINETPLPDVAPDTSTTVSPTFTPERLGPHDLRLVVTVGERSDYRTVALNVVEALAEAAESGSTEGDSAEGGAAPDDGSERDSAAAQGWIRAVLLGVMGVSGVVFVVGLALVITWRRRG